MSAIILDTHLCANFLGTWIRRALGLKAADQAAYLTDTSPRTTERWVRGKTAPNAMQLLRLARHPGFREELRRYLDQIEQQEAVIENELERVRAERLRAPARVVGSSGKPLRAAALRTSTAGTGVRRGGVKG